MTDASPIPESKGNYTILGPDSVARQAEVSGVKTARKAVREAWKL